MPYIRPRNWAEFQHYKDRSPGWIKLHKKLLDDYTFHCLPDASRALAPLLWLLASEFDDAKITKPIDEIAFRLHMRGVEFVDAVKPLIDKNFFESDIPALAARKQDAIPEREGEKEKQTKTETQSGADKPHTVVTKGVKAVKAAAKPPKVKPEPKPQPTRLPPDWQLSDRNREDAKHVGFDEAGTAKEHIRFRNHYVQTAGPGGVSLDWNLKWHGWLLDQAAKLKLTPKFPEEQREKTFPTRTVGEWQRFLKIYAATDQWLSGWGPRPGAPGCLVPPELLAENVEFVEDANAQSQT